MPLMIGVGKVTFFTAVSGDKPMQSPDFTKTEYLPGILVEYDCRFAPCMSCPFLFH